MRLRLRCWDRRSLPTSHEVVHHPVDRTPDFVAGAPRSFEDSFVGLASFSPLVLGE